MLLLHRYFHQSAVNFLTATEVATALRPFYFAVHPDLFGQHPKERLTNENSLKQLSSYLETLQKTRYVQPCKVDFYIRHKEQKQKFKLIQLDLRERDLRTVVTKVLKTCELSTEFIDSIAKPEIPKATNAQIRADRTYDIDLTNLDPNDVIFGPLAIKRKIYEAQESVRLLKWLSSNGNEALQRTKETMPVREDIAKLSKKLSTEWGLMDVRWECGWNVRHFKGCLQSFSVVAQEHPDNMHLLRGRILVFAPFTGVSLDGHIMLNSGEVRHNWLDLIKNIRKYDEHLERIPAFERSVSQVLLNIKVMRRKFMPKILAGEYERHLQQITTALSDYLTYRKYPKSWPNNLSTFQIVVETEAGPLMVSPTGQFIVPSSCPGSLLVNFITENMQLAKERIENYNKNKHVERSLQKECKALFNLLDLRKDDNVTPDMMIECCEKLKENQKHPEVKEALQELHLNISTYYSVLSDGIVCIPWNFRF